MTRAVRATRPRARATWGAAGLCLLLFVRAAAAEPATAVAEDGVYGRLDGDLDLGVALGGELQKDAVRAGARVTAHYFWTAGVYASYRNALGTDPPDARVVSVGADLRPLFIPRWSQHWEMGPPRLDLVLDSVSLSLGAYWANRAPERGFRRGLELGFGLGFPLVSEASGPWLGARGLARWAEPMFRGPELSGLLTAEWHWVVDTPIAASE